jgi:hypothetical protein
MTGEGLLDTSRAFLTGCLPQKIFRFLDRTCRNDYLCAVNMNNNDMNTVKGVFNCFGNISPLYPACLPDRFSINIFFAYENRNPFFRR